jgi:hypothetical protein
MTSKENREKVASFQISSHEHGSSVQCLPSSKCKAEFKRPRTTTRKKKKKTYRLQNASLVEVNKIS